MESFHLAAYTVALGTTANTDITALTDDIMLIQNNHFVPSKDMKIMAAYASSATLSRTRLNSPRIRQFAQSYIRPINVATLPAANPNIAFYFDAPIIIKAQEELQVEATSGIAMGTERFLCLLWLMDATLPGPIPAPQSDVYTIRITSTTAAVANSWTTISASYETQLPQGTYAVTNIEYQATNAMAIRAIFDGQFYRPGSLGTQALANRTSTWLSMSQMGVWGQFNTVTLPRLQVLNNSTDASHEIYMECSRVGP